MIEISQSLFTPCCFKDIIRKRGVISIILTTTPSVEGRKIQAYLGIVTGEAIMGANIVRDLFASITDIVGGRSGAYEEKLSQARKVAIEEMAAQARRLGANAVVGVDLDYEVIRDGMLMVTASGTAVTI
jgi:uncharacterized protein YbjQ (UPF0145 family)